MRPALTPPFDPLFHLCLLAMTANNDPKKCREFSCLQQKVAIFAQKIKIQYDLKENQKS